MKYNLSEKKSLLYKREYPTTGRRFQTGNTFKISPIGIPWAEKVREWLGKSF
jgi:hypothetical protein